MTAMGCMAGDAREWSCLTVGDLVVTEDGDRARAASGDADAACRLGRLAELRDGDCLAEPWYRRAVASGHVHAAYFLALILYCSGPTGSEREKEAFTLFGDAAEGGHGSAAYMYADMIDAIAGRDPHLERAATARLTALAEAGVSREALIAAASLASTPPDQAALWYRRALSDEDEDEDRAGDGAGDDIPSLAEALLHGEGIGDEDLIHGLEDAGDSALDFWRSAFAVLHKDGERALDLLRKYDWVADQSWVLDVVDAALADPSVDVDWALPWLRQAGIADCPIAKLGLSVLCYLRGEEPRAERWAKALDGDRWWDDRATRVVGRFEGRHGRDVAEGYLRFVAGVDVQWSLEIYADFVAEDPARAAEADGWYRRAVASGSMSAASTLARRVMATDPAQAEMLLSANADLGDANDARELIMMLRARGAASEAARWRDDLVDRGV